MELTLTDMLKEYGWIGVLVYYAVKELWPFFKKKVFPAQVRAHEAEVKLQSEQLKWTRDMEERRVQAMENASKAMIEHSRSVDEALRRMSDTITSQNQQVSLAITVQNERVSQLLVAHQKHDSFTIQAIGEMRARVPLKSSK